MLFFVEKFPGEKGSVTVCCCDATASPFAAKVLGKVIAHLHAVTVELHSTTHNWLINMPKKMMIMFLILLFTCLGEHGLSVHGSGFLPRTLV
jgi:hypothetical protein